MNRPTPAFQTNTPGQRDTQAPPFRAVRFIVDSLVTVASPAGKKAMLCYRFDGTNTGTRGVYVAPFDKNSPMAVGATLYAHVPQGGTGWVVVGSVSGNPRSIVWIQASDDSEGMYQYMVRQMVAQHQKGWGVPLAHPPMS